MDSLRIPLFPLDVVLLPKKSLPLHIFEPRYKLMIRNAVEQDAPFGVVRVLPVEPTPVSSTRLPKGTMARCGWEPGKGSADPLRQRAAKRFNS